MAATRVSSIVTTDDKGRSMPETMPREALWSAIRAERAALARDLDQLGEDGWSAATLCPTWNVEDVVAHLTAAASTGRVRWLTSMLGARFDMDVHNARGLAEHKGATPEETLERFRAVVGSTTAASGHLPAWLGEVVVHAQDIRLPLGLTTEPAQAGLVEVARFFASRDFAVNSASAVKDLRLEADDSDFTAGDGAPVRGRTLALVMAMAGRTAYLHELTGPGVDVLRNRVARP